MPFVVQMRGAVTSTKNPETTPEPRNFIDFFTLAWFSTPKPLERKKREKKYYLKLRYYILFSSFFKLQVSKSFVKCC